MSIQNDQELANTQNKLAQLKEWIDEAQNRPVSPENSESVTSLMRMANQLQEEIIQYRSQAHRRAS